LQAHQATGLGGVGFLVNLAVGQLGSFVSLYVYTVQITERATGGSVLWAVVIGTNVLLVASFTAFLMKINEDKVAGLLSLETNPENNACFTSMTTQS